MTTPTMLHLTEGQVSDLADGTLDPHEQQVVLAHVGHCTICRDEVAETRALLAWSRSASAGISAPAELWPLVASATIHSPRRSLRTVVRATRVLLVVAFAILAVSFALSLRARLRDDPSPAVATGSAVPAPPSAGQAPRPPQPTRSPDAPSAPDRPSADR